jgi:hypothetical protein
MKATLNMKRLLIFFLILPSGLISGQYDAGSIPPELLINANAVVRKQDEVFTVTAINRATYRFTHVITVLNERGKSHGIFAAHYDKFTKANFIGGSIYDSKGNLQRKVRKKDINDFSYYSGSIFDDNRVITYVPVVREYPYTVEYTWELNLSALFSLPDWKPVSSTNLSLERAVFSLNVPDSYGFRYIEKNIQNPATKISGGNVLTYTWECGPVKAIQPQFYSKPLSSLLPVVHLAPDLFSIDNRPGSMRSWEDFSNWIFQLNSGRDKLPEATKNRIVEMVKDIDDDLIKAKMIYEYMQSRTRYVGIQLGIGGFQPFEAELVDRLGYGDCKALSNYTKALLDVAGIESIYAIVRAGPGAEPIIDELPSNQFNHAILCLPFGNDTIWLECTSQHTPFGYLGNLTSDRHALLISDSGGKLVKTTRYSEKENFRDRYAEIDVFSSGDATINMRTRYSGLLSDECRQVSRNGPQEQRKWLAEYIGLVGLQLNSLSFDQGFETVPGISSEAEFSVRSYASATGKRLFIPLNQFSRWKLVMPAKPDITRDFQIWNSYTYNDKYLFTVHENIKIEAIPEKVVIQSRFGEYSSWVELDDDQFIYYRNLILNRGEYPADLYDEFSAFTRDIARADQAQIILLRE